MNIVTTQISAIKTLHLTKVPILQVNSISFPNAALTSCPLIFTHFWVGETAKQQQTHPKVSKKKVGNWSELHSEKKTKVK